MYNIVYKFFDKGAPLCHSLNETVISLNQAERMFKVKRKLKGTLSFVLAMIMVFSLGTAAFAEEADVQPVVCAGSADAEDCAPRHEASKGNLFAEFPIKSPGCSHQNGKGTGSRQISHRFRHMEG